jgi:hypothetical protein
MIQAFLSYESLSNIAKTETHKTHFVMCRSNNKLTPYNGNPKSSQCSFHAGIWLCYSCFTAASCCMLDDCNPLKPNGYYMYQLL